MTNGQEKYLIEYEKYKHIMLAEGSYQKKDASHIRYEIKNIDYNTEQVHLKNLKSNNELIKTLHWCRKNLAPLTLKEKE